jgi:tetratricopeptide (TPR) repeat protein
MSNVTFQPEERARSYKKLEEDAIALARESRWEEAAEKNRELLALYPEDVSGYNRLGKALSELGHYAEARQAYTDALEIDPSNNIARKNVERLKQAQESGEASDANHANNARAADRIDPRLFIEETGKTGFTTLVDLAPPNVLARVSAGDQVRLHPEGSLLYVENAAGERIGRIEPRLANRLIKFMDGGNQYAAGIAEQSDHEVRLIIRETFQDPKQFGKVSFPSQGGGETIRAYTKDSMVRRDRDDEDEGADDGEYTDDTDEEDTDEKADVELEESDLFEPEE